MANQTKRHVFIIGSNGIPAQYGGFETFVEKLTYHSHNEQVQFHVSCLSDQKGEYIYNNARCFKIRVPKVGPGKAILYDLFSLDYCCKYIKNNHVKNAVVYILGCSIGPFMKHYAARLHKLGSQIFINPDGLEWKRAKWSYWVRKYLRLSEKQMVKHADQVICDSQKIKEYIDIRYVRYNPKTCFIAYGAEIKESACSDEAIKEWYHRHGLRKNEFYLVVGRFVPENNYETILREFMKAKTTKDLVLITNVDNNPFYSRLKESTGFDKDPRIKFVGTVYDQELLLRIRQEALAYIHGHEVGGTNPSLLEALANTNANIVLGVDFNKEVAQDAAWYFTKDDDSLAKLIDNLETADPEKFKHMGQKAKERIQSAYSWESICGTYETIFFYLGSWI